MPTEAALSGSGVRAAGLRGPVGEITDGNPLPPTGSSSIADFTATIDWGDGAALDALGR